MATFLTVVLVIAALVLIGLVMLQSSKSAGLGAIAGGAEQLFGKQKARGVDLVLHRVTIGAAVIFFLAAIALAYFIK